MALILVESGKTEEAKKAVAEDKQILMTLSLILTETNLFGD
jgi:hypothetical protein